MGGGGGGGGGTGSLLINQAVSLGRSGMMDDGEGLSKQ